MDDVTLGVLLGLMATALFGLILRLEACHRGLIGALQRSKDDLVGQIDQRSQLSISDNVISMIQDEIQESITNFAGNMRVPTAIDHLAGVAANIFQMREQWKIQKEAAEINANPLISPSSDGLNYGAQENEAKDYTQG